MGGLPAGYLKERERGMNWADKAGRENTVSLNNSKLTGGMLERNRLWDLSLPVCSHMLAVVLNACLNPRIPSRCCVCIPQPPHPFNLKEMPLFVVSGRRCVTSAGRPVGVIPCDFVHTPPHTLTCQDTLRH